MKMVVNKNVERKNEACKKVRFKTPFQWTECAKCGNKFKFEPMYMMEVYSFRGTSYIYSPVKKYGCRECFESIMDFYDFIHPEKPIDFD